MSDSELIDQLGGTKEVAHICDVRPQAVSQWKRNGIPDARRTYLSLLFPDLVKYQPKYEARDVA